MADYLCVSTDYLLTGQDGEQSGDVITMDSLRDIQKASVRNYESDKYADCRTGGKEMKFTLYAATCREKRKKISNIRRNVEVIDEEKFEVCRCKFDHVSAKFTDDKKKQMSSFIESDCLNV